MNSHCKDFFIIIGGGLRRVKAHLMRLHLYLSLRIHHPSTHNKYTIYLDQNKSESLLYHLTKILVHYNRMLREYHSILYQIGSPMVLEDVRQCFLLFRRQNNARHHLIKTGIKDNTPE